MKASTEKLFFVVRHMPRSVLGESCTTSIKNLTIFPLQKKKKKKKFNMYLQFWSSIISILQNPSIKIHTNFYQKLFIRFFSKKILNIHFFWHNK